MGLFGSPTVEKLEAKHDLKGLAKSLTDHDPNIRQAAARALRRLDESGRVLPLIVDRLKIAAEHVRAGKADPHSYEEGVGVLRGVGAPAVAHLMAAVRRSHGYDQVDYVILLGLLGEPLALEPLLEASRDTSSADLRAAAVTGLGAIATQAAWERITELFHNDPAFDVRSCAAVILAGHANRGKQTGAYETFMASLGSEDPASRALAAAGLGAVNDTRAVERLGQLTDNDPDPRVRQSAKSALSSLTVSGHRSSP